jgi:colicin import membrane protein
LARKLKVYQTALGFFEEAIAAPSMKAALEAWGSNSNLFHQGAAKETNDPEIVAAALAKPGVVLRRAVGSSGPFTEHAALPTDLDGEDVSGRPKKSAPRRKKQPPGRIDDKAAREAGLEYERAEARRESERRKVEGRREKERQRREQAIAKAQAAFDNAQRDHEARASAIEAERSAVENRAHAEEDRWQKQKQKLDLSLRRARS